MRRRSRTRRVLKWVGTLSCVLLAVGWGASRFVAISWYRASDGRHVGVRRGEAFVYWRNGFLPPTSQPGWTVSGRPGHDWPAGWLPRVDRYTSVRFSNSRVTVPLWIPFMIVATPTAMLWCLGRRRVPAGHCQKCGYDLTGNVSGRCPECGRLIEREGKTA